MGETDQRPTSFRQTDQRLASCALFAAFRVERICFLLTLVWKTTTGRIQILQHRVAVAFIRFTLRVFAITLFFFEKWLRCLPTAYGPLPLPASQMASLHLPM